MNKQETYQYLKDYNIPFEITEHRAVYNMEELDSFAKTDAKWKLWKYRRKDGTRNYERSLFPGTEVGAGNERRSNNRPGFDGHTAGAPRRMRGHGGQHDRYPKEHHYRKHGHHGYGHVQSENPLGKETIRDGRRMPLPYRCPQNHPIRRNRGGVPGHGLEAAAESVHRLDRTDYPARSGPLQRHCHLVFLGDYNRISHKRLLDNWNLSSRYNEIRLEFQSDFTLLFSIMLISVNIISVIHGFIMVFPV